MVICFTISLVGHGTVIPAQEDEETTGLIPAKGRRITGAVDLIIEGQPQLKTGIEILAIARRAKFNEGGRCERKSHDGSCTITYVPQEAIPNATRRALSEGLLLYRFTVEGTPPRTLNVTPGTYYFFIQYVNGRWVGTAVDLKGRVRCATFGVIVRQVFSIHPGDDHQPESRVVAHKIAGAKELAKLGPRSSSAAADWADVQIGWEPFGAGCWKDIVCVPGT